LSGRALPNIMRQNNFLGVSAMASSHVFAGVGGYYGGNQGNLAGVFRRDTEGTDWQHVLTEPEAYTVFVHPRDPNLVLAGTKDGIYRSTDGGATFKRANFPDSGVQVWSFLPDPADPKRLLAGGSPASIYRSTDAGESWTRQADPKLPDRGKAPFAVRVMRFARHPRRPDEIYAALEVGGVMRSTDGGESWSDCSEHLIRLSVEEPRLRSKIVSDTEAEGMLDGHAICMSAADPDAVVLAVRMGLFRSEIRARPGRICGSTVFRRSLTAATSRCRRRTRTRSMRA
jgi:Sortilin, neurotensin receptor 3,